MQSTHSVTNHQVNSPSPHKIRIMLSAGELSGDEHAAALALALKSTLPGVVMRGMGGRNMRLAGVETFVDCEKSAGLMGFSSVFRSLGKTLRALRDMKEQLKTWRPNVLVIVDYADFNLNLARCAKSLSIPVVYFIPPKVWAWRESRIKKIHKLCTQIISIFPFEKTFFQARGCPQISYVGHPFFDTLLPHRPSNEQRGAKKLALGFDPSAPLLALLPGSRRLEIQQHLLPMVAGLKLIKVKHPNLQVLVSVAPSIELEWLKELCQDRDIHFSTHNSLEIMRAADAGLLKSGTNNLQAVFCDLPFTMFYIVKEPTATLLRIMLKIKEYSIVNIIRSQTVRELFQEHTTPEIVAKELESLLYNDEERTSIKNRMQSVVDQLGSHDQDPRFTQGMTAYQRAARIVVDCSVK